MNLLNDYALLRNMQITFNFKKISVGDTIHLGDQYDLIVIQKQRNKITIEILQNDISLRPVDYKKLN